MIGESIHFSKAHVKGLKFVQGKLIQNHSANKKGSVTQIFELSNFPKNVPYNDNQRGENRSLSPYYTVSFFLYFALVFYSNAKSSLNVIIKMPGVLSDPMQAKGKHA